MRERERERERVNNGVLQNSDKSSFLVFHKNSFITEQKTHLPGMSDENNDKTASSRQFCA